MKIWTLITYDGVEYVIPSDADTFEEACADAAALSNLSVADFNEKFTPYFNRERSGKGVVDTPSA
jgi:hypothetical protein